MLIPKTYSGAVLALLITLRNSEKALVVFCLQKVVDGTTKGHLKLIGTVGDALGLNSCVQHMGETWKTLSSSQSRLYTVAWAGG